MIAGLSQLHSSWSLYISCMSTSTRKKNRSAFVYSFMSAVFCLGNEKKTRKDSIRACLDFRHSTAAESASTLRVLSCCRLQCSEPCCCCCCRCCCCWSRVQPRLLGRWFLPTDFIISWLQRKEEHETNLCSMAAWLLPITDLVHGRDEDIV